MHAGLVLDSSPNHFVVLSHNEDELSLKGFSQQGEDFVPFRSVGKEGFSVDSIVRHSRVGMVAVLRPSL